MKRERERERESWPFRNPRERRRGDRNRGRHGREGEGLRRSRRETFETPWRFVFTEREREREIMDLWVTVRKRAKREVFVVNLFCFFYMRSLSLHDKLEMRSLRGLWGFEIHFSPVMITTVTPAHKYHILAHHSQNSPTPVYRQNILCKNTHYVKIHM